MLRVILGVLFALSAQAASAATAREQLVSFLQGVQVLKADFVQTVVGDFGEIVEQSEGELALSAPRQFRFEYREPYPQLLLADGEKLWIYDPDLEQVTVRAQSMEEANSPLTLILEPESLEQTFTVTEGGSEHELDWLLLTPTEERNDFDRLDLGFDGKGLKVMSYRDPSGLNTRLVFSDWQRDPRLAADFFAFEPPAGVDVVGLELIDSATVKPLDD